MTLSLFRGREDGEHNGSSFAEISDLHLRQRMSFLFEMESFGFFFEMVSLDRTKYNLYIIIIVYISAKPEIHHVQSSSLTSSRVQHDNHSNSILLDKLNQDKWIQADQPTLATHCSLK